MAEPFAVLQDVEDRWRPITSDDEITVATTLIDDASDMIRVRWPDVDDRVTDGSLTAASLTRVVANMVKRAMLVGDTAGIESRSLSSGPFSVSDKFANPTANLYLTAEDIRLFEPNGYAGRARMGWLG